MKRKIFSLISVTVLIAVFASQALASEITVRGRLQRTVESGGWLIVSNNEKYLVLNAARFSREAWFAERNEVEATGELKPDVVTTQMEGTPFEARTMTPLQQSGGLSQSKSLSRVIVSGDSIIQAQPDTAILTVSVVTQGKRAIDAQQENASKSEAMVQALRRAAGANSEVKTSGYSLQPMRVYKEGQPPVITGYEARNSVTVTMSDLTKVGPVIDAASLAGANDVAGLQFTLRNDRPARDQALAEATREGLNKAQVIAKAIGGKLVRIVEVQEEGTNRPRPVYEVDQMAVRTSMAANTPIAVGSLDITSRVQMIVEIEAVL